MAYGVGKHYQGDLGESYYGWQQRGAELAAEIDAFKFEPHVGPSDTVVDFGCGGGAMLARLQVGRRIGIEPNDPARAAAAARGLEMVAAPTELGDAIADVIISNHALEHVLAPLDALRELHRILRPDGTFVLWLPLDDWRVQRHIDPTDVNHHLYTWTPLLLGSLLDEAGFAIERCEVVSHAWPQFHDRLYRVLPRAAFDRVAQAWSIARRHRQVMALARRPAA